MTEEVTTTPQVSEVETSQVSEQETQVAETTESPEEVTEQPTEESAEVEQQEAPKQTRAEKRLHQLLAKGKPNRDSFYDLMEQMPQVTPSEDGTLTQEQLQQLIAQETARTLRLHQEQQDYQSQITTFSSEVEEVGSQIDKDFSSNPKLAEKVNAILTKTLQAANLRTDASGREVLVPVLSPKEAYQQLKELYSLTTNTGAAQATAKLAQQIAEGAVTPSTRGGDEGINVADLTDAEIFKNPSAVRQALEKKLSA